MQIQELGIAVLWTFLYGYLIVASIDFGAGFFAFYSRYTKRDHLVNRLVKRYLSPTWEVTNVFFVFFFVGIVGFFPDTAYYYGTALLVPASVVLILLAIRGSFYAFANYGSKESTLYMFLYGATGLLIPASMSTVLTVRQRTVSSLTGRSCSPTSTRGRSSSWRLSPSSIFAPCSSCSMRTRHVTKMPSNSFGNGLYFGASRQLSHRVSSSLG